MATRVPNFVTLSQHVTSKLEEVLASLYRSKRRTEGNKHGYTFTPIFPIDKGTIQKRQRYTSNYIPDSSQTHILPIFCLKPPLLCLLSVPNLPFDSYLCLKSSIPHPVVKTQILVHRVVSLERELSYRCQTKDTLYTLLYSHIPPYTPLYTPVPPLHIPYLLTILYHPTYTGYCITQAEGLFRLRQGSPAGPDTTVSPLQSYYTRLKR